MFKQVAICGKLALVVGIVFFILGITSLITEVKSGIFHYQRSFGLVTILAGISSMFFYWVKYQDAKAGKAPTCQMK